MFGRATIRLGIGPHSSCYFVFELRFLRPTGHKVGHFGDVLPCHSLGIVLKLIVIVLLPS